MACEGSGILAFDQRYGSVGSIRMIARFRRVGTDLLNRVVHSSAIPVVYFARTSNVGDLLNPYMIPKLAGRPIYRARSTLFPHVRAIGSVIGSANRQSYVWGSGSIDGKVPDRALDPSKVFALRGKLTRSMLSEACGVSPSVPLGDPAILMPDFYNPPVEVEHQCGIVPHFEDLELVLNLSRKIAGVKVIDVRQKPEDFVTDLKACRRVISSSLHGLILSDAYGIPNVRATFSDKLLGGDFKFSDYYSTTDCEDAFSCQVIDEDQLRELVAKIERSATVARSVVSTTDLLDAFSQMHESMPSG
ncbi:polysaccharide pyruvyl transferase family protein [Erythrobacter sp. LQ02-29]|uniref:polysaccharide pyruvyl transferase family protein n=1 Tax=Erythrobacter sp. LQ02-29 TaxID=2920384 RepID=UPI00277D0CB2|nr:polysaccharide pyruvyl transferase family protein [Erythrobacter sp. LQ02-29]